jgi:hypothetical protein
LTQGVFPNNFFFPTPKSDLKGGDMVVNKFKKSFLGGLFFGLAAMLIVTSPALAVETKWAVLQGDWNIPGNWTGGVVPTQGDDVLIDIPGAEVTYQNSSNPTLNSLQLGLKPEESSSLEFLFYHDPKPGQDLLTVKNAEIGSKGTANYFHNGGSLKVLQDLTLGTAIDGQGLYYMGGSGALSVGGNETLGQAGAGYLLQLGSTISSGRPPALGCTPPKPTSPPVVPPHSVGKNLYLGVESGSDGEFNLSASSLTVGGSIRVGIKGTGLFDQDSSIVKIKGNDPDPLANDGVLSSSPVFSAISKTNLKNNKLECVSSRGPGLIVGLENEGYYNLKGGTLNVNYSEIIGLDENGEGYFDQSNGTHIIDGNLYLAKEANSYGQFLFSVPQSSETPTPPEVGLLDVHGFASVGYLGEGWFLQNGGTVKIRGIDQEVNLKGTKSLSTTLSKGASISCSQQQYTGFTVGRGGIGAYDLNDGELLVSRGEIIGMLSGSNGTFSQFGGNHFIGGNLTIARDSGSKGLYTLTDGTLKVQGSLLNNPDGTFDYYGGELLANVINKGTFNAYGPGTRAFPKQFFNYGTFKLTSPSLGTAAFAQKFRNYGIYESSGNPGVDSRFTYLYIADQGRVVAGALDNYYVAKEFINTSTRKTEWKTDTANLIFTGPGRKPFKTGSANNGADGFADNFAWGSLGIEGNGSVQLLGHLYADQIRGVNAKELSKKITNLFGYCGIHIYYNSADVNNSYLNDWILTTAYGKPVGKFTDSGFKTEGYCQ